MKSIIRDITDVVVQDWVTNSDKRYYEPYFNIKADKNILYRSMLLFETYETLECLYTRVIENNLNVTEIIVE